MKKEHRAYAFVTERIKFRDCIFLCLFVLFCILFFCVVFFYRIQNGAECMLVEQFVARSDGFGLTTCIEQSDNKIPFGGNSYSSQKNHKELIAVIWNSIYVKSYMIGSCEHDQFFAQFLHVLELSAFHCYNMIVTI